MPDTNATYWLTPYLLLPGMTLTASGAYPFGRYFSLATYAPGGVTVDGRADAAIEPDEGSRNPFTDPNAGRDLATRRWRAIFRAGPEGASPNAISAGSGRGWVAYRVYVPDDPHDQKAGVPLPRLRLTWQVGPWSLMDVVAPTCARSAATRRAGRPELAEGATASEPSPAFVRPASLDGPFANPDNAYLAAHLAWHPGRVVVVRGRAATFPDTRRGEPAAAQRQLRYWSLCTNAGIPPYPVAACSGDFETTLHNGSYTFVISTVADRPSNADTTHGVTWLDWGRTDVDGVVLLRNMLPSPEFPEAIQNVPRGEPGTIAMGEYSPVARYCSRMVFEAGGAESCLTAPSEPVVISPFPASADHRP